MAKWIVKAPVGKPWYMYDLDLRTLRPTKKIEGGKDYVDFPTKSKREAYKLAYRLSKTTNDKNSGHRVEIWTDLGKNRLYEWGVVNYTDNPKAWFYKKVIISSMDDLFNYRQLKYDGTIGKIIKKKWEW